MKSAPVPESLTCPFCHPERMLLENELACTIADTTPILCYQEDMSDPRGGVRGVIPSRKSY